MKLQIGDKVALTLPYCQPEYYTICRVTDGKAVGRNNISAQDFTREYSDPNEIKPKPYRMKYLNCYLVNGSNKT